MSFLPPLTKKTSYYFLAVMVLFIFALDYAFFMRFQTGTLRSLSSKTASFKKNIQETKNNIDRFSAYESEVDDLQKRSESIKASVVLQEKIPLVMENISRIARESGIQIDQMMPARESQKQISKAADGPYYTLPILIRGQGPYHAIGRFFNGIETESIFMKIQDFDIAQNAMNSRSHALSATVVIVIRENLKK